jgi:hypothetical protein
MGRQSHNNLVVEDSRVSRSHARIVFRQNEFVLIDHSTNGTYVFVKGEKGMNLKQNELLLQGSGIFGLGRKVAPDSPEAIHYAVIPSCPFNRPPPSQGPLSGKTDTPSNPPSHVPSPLLNPGGRRNPSSYRKGDFRDAGSGSGIPGRQTVSAVRSPPERPFR